MSNITLRIVDKFFDKPAVKNAVARAGKRNLSKAGAHVRRTSRRSIRKGPKRRTKKGRRTKRARDHVSRPGQPPRSHTGGRRNLKLILFGYEAERQTVVVGPVRFGSGANVPQLLEHGGVGRVNGRAARYAARPFMRPALAAEAPKFPQLFANSVR